MKVSSKLLQLLQTTEVSPEQLPLLHKHQWMHIHTETSDNTYTTMHSDINTQIYWDLWTQMHMFNYVNYLLILTQHRRDGDNNNKQPTQHNAHMACCT